MRAQGRCEVAEATPVGANWRERGKFAPVVGKIRPRQFVERALLHQIIKQSIGGDVELVVIFVRAGLDLRFDRGDLVNAHVAARF